MSPKEYNKILNRRIRNRKTSEEKRMVGNLEKLALRCMTANEINTFCRVMQKRSVADFGEGCYKIESPIRKDPKMQMRLMNILETKRFL
jgi:hypothetical protein